jgi:hypothetical protein
MLHIAAGAGAGLGLAWLLRRMRIWK